MFHLGERMLRFKQLMLLALFTLFIFQIGCIFDENSPDRVDYGNGFYFKWYTFIGDSGNNQKATDITHDSEGNIYIIGSSDSPLDRVYGEPISPFSNDNQSLLIKLNSDGIILWHTFLPDGNYKIVIDNTDKIVLCGGTSKAFIISGIDPVSSHNGEYDISLVKLNSDGFILWYTFLGGAKNDSRRAIHIDRSGTIYILGSSRGKWDGKFGLPVTDAIFSYDGATLSFSKVNYQGYLTSHTFSNYKGNYLSPNSFYVTNNGKIYALATDSITKYSTPIGWELSSDLELIYIGKGARLYGTVYNLKDGNLFSYENNKFIKYDLDLNQIWKYEIKNETNDPSKHAKFWISDLKIDKNDDIYFTGANSGKLLKEYYDFPIISPLLKYLNERTDNTILSRKMVMKINNNGSLEWYSYFGDSNQHSLTYTPYSLEITDSDSIFITENNSNKKWPDIYGNPNQIYTGSPEAKDSEWRSTILLAKFQNNPKYPEIRIYEKVYKKLVLLRKKTYIKLEYSFYLPSGYAQDDLKYILYKFDNENKTWEVIENYKAVGEYSYKDKHVYQEEFNHYKISAFNKSGEKIAESRIVSVYPPRPNLNIDLNGE